MPCIIEPPRTPLDPCDRVKFILGEEGLQEDETSHHIFTELEELCYSDHGQKYVERVSMWELFAC